MFSSKVKRVLPEDSVLITSYANNLFSVIWHSCIFVPKAFFLLLKFRWQGVRKLYFTVFHPWNLIFIFYAKGLGISTILTIHDFRTHMGERSIWVECIQKWSMRWADKLVFLSQAERQKAILYKQKWALKSEVILHPLLPIAEPNRQEHSSRMKFLFLGRIKEYKGVELAYKTARANNFNLTIAGKGKLEKIYTTDKIRVIDKYLSTPEICALLANHHVLLIPYLEASQSGILALGLAAEMVMIVSRTGGLTEQVDAESAIWTEANYEELEKTMRMLAGSADLYAKTKHNCRAFKQAFKLQWHIDFKRFADNNLV